MAFFTRLLNAVGLHTQAELDAARAVAKEESKVSAQPPTRSPITPNSRVADEAGFTNAEARRIFEHAMADFADLPIAMQVQVKSQAIEKMRALVTKGRLDASEFERWKRRLLTR